MKVKVVLSPGLPSSWLAPGVAAPNVRSMSSSLMVTVAPSVMSMSDAGMSVSFGVTLTDEMLKVSVPFGLPSTISSLVIATVNVAVSPSVPFGNASVGLVVAV